MTPTHTSSVTHNYYASPTAPTTMISDATLICMVSADDVCALSKAVSHGASIINPKYKSRGYNVLKPYSHSMYRLLIKCGVHASNIKAPK
jgi:hypothetical protein